VRCPLTEHHWPDAPSRRSARIRTQGRSSQITLCVSRHGTGVWPEFRERPRPARTSAPLTAGHPGTAGNAAGHLPVRATLAAGSPPPAGEGPVPDVCPEGSGRRPRRSGSLEAIRAAAWLGVTYRGKVVSRGRAAPPRHRVPVPGTGRTATPGGRLVFHVLAALAELIRDSSRRGSRCPAPRPCSTARQWRCRPGFAAHPAPRSADLGQRRVRRAAADRDLTWLRIPAFPAGTAAGPGTA
jgi:hypothetical protein